MLRVAGLLIPYTQELLTSTCVPFLTPDTPKQVKYISHGCLHTLTTIHITRGNPTLLPMAALPPVWAPDRKGPVITTARTASMPTPVLRDPGRTARTKHRQAIALFAWAFPTASPSSGLLSSFLCP